MMLSTSEKSHYRQKVEYRRKEVEIIRRRFFEIEKIMEPLIKEEEYKENTRYCLENGVSDLDRQNNQL